MTLEEVILELYRLAETKEWDGGRTDEAVFAAIEGLEQIWALKQAEMQARPKAGAVKRPPRVWS